VDCVVSVRAVFRLSQRLLPLSSQRQLSTTERRLWRTWWLWWWCRWTQLWSVYTLIQYNTIQYNTVIF